MEATFALKDIDKNLYFYGFYSNQEWTPKIQEAKTQDKEYFIELLQYNPEPFNGKILTVIEIYKP